MNEIFIELLQPLTKADEELFIQDIISLGYNREEAINILGGLNPDGTEYKELPF